MTRTEFQLIAAALKRCKAPRYVVDELAGTLRTRNPKFDRRRFFVESGFRDVQEEPGGGPPAPTPRGPLH